LKHYFTPNPITRVQADGSLPPDSARPFMAYKIHPLSLMSGEAILFCLAGDGCTMAGRHPCRAVIYAIPATPHGASHYLMKSGPQASRRLSRRRPKPYSVRPARSCLRAATLQTQRSFVLAPPQRRFLSSCDCFGYQPESRRQSAAGRSVVAGPCGAPLP